VIKNHPIFTDDGGYHGWFMVKKKWTGARPGHGHSGFREIQGRDDRNQRFLIRCRHRCRDSWYPQSKLAGQNVPNCPEFPVEMGDFPASQVWFEDLQPMISAFWMINSFLEHVNDHISKCPMVKSNYVWWN